MTTVDLRTRFESEATDIDPGEFVRRSRPNSSKHTAPTPGWARHVSGWHRSPSTSTVRSSRSPREPASST